MQMITFEQCLRESAVPREEIDKFLSGTGWMKLDPELGYVPNTYRAPGGTFVSGIDGTGMITTQQKNDARYSFLYKDQEPRINTYGNSFTQCTQVNDGETWQEYLAGHLCEPIGNFGVADYGVYQTYLRMKREESSDHGAQYLVFYVWGDDPFRNLYRSHAPIFRGSTIFSKNGLSAFLGMMRPYIEMDLSSGRFVERDNLLRTPESNYSLCDPQFLVEHLKDDIALQLSLFSEGEVGDIDRPKVDRLSSLLGISFDWSRDSVPFQSRGLPILGQKPNDSSEVTLQSQAHALLDRYAMHATIFVLEKAGSFARQHGKELLVVLFDPYRAMLEMQRGQRRYDQDLVDFLSKRSFRFFDMNEAHLHDFKKYRVDFGEYRKQFFVDSTGHYNPRGNHLFAYSMKDAFVEWLNPKPILYQERALGLPEDG
jgi:hypothetical protein